jgi:hypothetical protein
VCIGLGETIGGFMQGKFLLFRAVNDFMCIKMHHVFFDGPIKLPKANINCPFYTFKLTTWSLFQPMNNPSNKACDLFLHRQIKIIT